MGEMDYPDLPVHPGNQGLPVSLLSFSFSSSVIISIIIMGFQLDPYDCRVEFDVA